MKGLPAGKVSFMKAGMFTASLTGKPFSGSPYDQWIERTMNKVSKMKGGWIGITQDEEALQTNVKIVNKITKVQVKLTEIAKLKQRQYKHIECSPSRMKIDEEAVQNANECLQKWNSVPWDTDLTIPLSIKSSLLASEKVQDDFLTAKKAGKEKLEIFFQDIILSNVNKILDRIPVSKRSKFTKPLKEENVEKSRNTDRMENRAWPKFSPWLRIKLWIENN